MLADEGASKCCFWIKIFDTAATFSSTGTQISSNFHLQISNWESVIQDLDAVTDSVEDEEHHIWISVSNLRTTYCQK